MQTNAENRTSDELDAILDELTIDQIRFVIARQDCSTDREAAKMIGLSEGTVYRWGGEVKRAVQLMIHDGVITALKLRRRSLAKAMAVKVKGLDSKDARLQQNVSTEIIEWELGKAQQAVDLTSNGEPIRLEVVWDESTPETAT